MEAEALDKCSSILKQQNCLKALMKSGDGSTLLIITFFFNCFITPTCRVLRPGHAHDVPMLLISISVSAFLINDILNATYEH